MLTAVGLEMLVYSCYSKICMIHRCKKCPGLKEVEQYLQYWVGEMRKDKESDEDDDDDDGDEQGDKDNDGDDKEDDEFEIEFKQWRTTNRT